MKIRIINPDYGTPRELMDRETAMLQRVVDKDTELSMECLTETKVEIDSAREAVLAGPEILRMTRRAEEEGCDAAVIYCFSDPALEACQESVSIPVVGGAQSAMLASVLTGKRAGVLITSEQRIPEKELFLRTLGVDSSRLAGIASLNWHLGSIWEHRKEAAGALIETGQRLVKENHADVLVMGCLAFLGLGKEVEQGTGVPVIDPAVAAVLAAEAMVKAKRM
jgi:allantoin racemase